MRIRAALLAGLGATACFGDDFAAPPGPPFSDSAIVYRIEPSQLRYAYLDSTSVVVNYQLRWLYELGFNGLNCIGFVPRSATDTIGRFQFYFTGANSGLLERTQAGSGTDTTTGYFIYEGIGSEGAYAVDSQNRLRLFWDSGVEARYFDPAAVLHFDNDTLWSNVDQGFQGDSVHVVWRVAWVRNACVAP